MTFEEFLAYIRKKVGYYCNDGYWRGKYNNLQPASKEDVDKVLSSLAINAIGTDSSTRPMPLESYLQTIPSEYRDWPLAWYESLDDGDFDENGKLIGG